MGRAALVQVAGAALGNMDYGPTSGLLPLDSAAIIACGDNGMRYT